MASIDVTVRGGGIFGLATAWALTKRGAKVRLIEPVRIGAGASGGIVGALAPHAPEKWNPLKEFQLDSLLMAQDWWAEVAAIGGHDPGYLRAGRLQPITDEAGLTLAQERSRDAARLWRGQAEWQVIPATGQEFEPSTPTGFLIRDTLSARISPRAGSLALVAALQAKGAEVQIGEAADEGSVVHATGWQGFAPLSQQVGRKVGGGQKGQAALLRYDATALPQIYAASLHVVPHADGTVAIGSTSESEWSDEAPDTQALELISRARALLPALEQAEVLETWAGIRPRAKTRGPIAGAWPDRPGHFIANGGFKIGFGMAPKIAEGLADQIVTGTITLPQIFSPERLWE